LSCEIGYFVFYGGAVKAKIHYTSFPVSSPEHKRQVCNKLVRVKVRCVVSFPKFHYNDLKFGNFPVYALEVIFIVRCAI